MPCKAMRFTVIGRLATACALCASVSPVWAEKGYACLIEPYQRIELRSAVEARIDAIRVDRGSEVRKGQLLVELDSAAERAALDGARYRAVMEGELASADSRVEAAKGTGGDSLAPAVENAKAHSG